MLFLGNSLMIPSSDWKRVQIFHIFALHCNSKLKHIHNSEVLIVTYVTMSEAMSEAAAALSTVHKLKCTAYSLQPFSMVSPIQVPTKPNPAPPILRSFQFSYADEY